MGGLEEVGGGEAGQAEGAESRESGGEGEMQQQQQELQGRVAEGLGPGGGPPEEGPVGSPPGGQAEGGQLEQQEQVGPAEPRAAESAAAGAAEPAGPAPDAAAAEAAPGAAPLALDDANAAASAPPTATTLRVRLKPPGGAAAAVGGAQEERQRLALLRCKHGLTETAARRLVPVDPDFAPSGALLRDLVCGLLKVGGGTAAAAAAPHPPPLHPPAPAPNVQRRLPCPTCKVPFTCAYVPGSRCLGAPLCLFVCLFQPRNTHAADAWVPGALPANCVCVFQQNARAWVPVCAGAGPSLPTSAYRPLAADALPLVVPRPSQSPAAADGAPLLRPAAPPSALLLLLPIYAPPQVIAGRGTVDEQPRLARRESEEADNPLPWPERVSNVVWGAGGEVGPEAHAAAIRLGYGDYLDLTAQVREEGYMVVSIATTE